MSLTKPLPSFVPILDQRPSALCRAEENTSLQKKRDECPFNCVKQHAGSAKLSVGLLCSHDCHHPFFCLAFPSFSYLPCPQRHLQSHSDPKLSQPHSSHPPPHPPSQIHLGLLCLLKGTSVRVAFWRAVRVCSQIWAEPREEASPKQHWGVFKSRSGCVWSLGLLGSRVQICAQGCHSQRAVWGCCCKRLWTSRGNVASTRVSGHLNSECKLADLKSRSYLGMCK